MYRRSELRHACYRAKKNAATAENTVLLDVIKPLLKPGQDWDNFSTSWDILITRDKTIKIIKPELDYAYVHSTLLEAAMLSKNNKDFSEFNDRQLNIIEQTETLMLDSVMTWKNYNRVWGVDIDLALKTFRTRLYDVDPNQIEVTDSMIEASKKDADGSPMNLTQQSNSVNLEYKPMSNSEKKLFQKLVNAQKTKK